jgi:AcrR family transcriptional regulator
MEKTRNSQAWLEEGYTLFANEGLEGIQIERLARILQLNKSGFYHYFGDLDGYYSELLNLHKEKGEISKIETIDPDFFNVVVKFKIPVMFHWQLIRIQNKPEFFKVAEAIDQKEDEILSQRWSEYLGIEDNPELAIRYFIIVRDMAYTRMSTQNLDFDFMRNVFTEAKVLMQQIAESKNTLADGTSF